jgi:hypothetical protein
LLLKYYAARLHILRNANLNEVVISIPHQRD